LRHPPLVLRNLIPNEAGEIHVDIDSDEYSNLLVVACDDYSITQNSIDIPNAKDEI